MSSKAVSWVWNSSKTKGTAKLVLLAIADHAWQDGTNAWPSVERLAKMTGLDPETVRRAVKKAEALGELEVVRKSGGRASKGQHASNDYLLVMSQDPQDAALKDPQDTGLKDPQDTGVNPRRIRDLTPAECGTNKTMNKNTNKQTADEVTRRWWEASNPKPMPAGGFVGARKIVEKAITAGWTASDLDKALPQVETLAFWSLEKALKQNQQQLVPQNEAWW